MKNFILSTLLIIAGLLFVTGIVWDFVSYFQNWKSVLSSFDTFQIYWKPTVLIIGSVVLLFVTFNIKNQKLK